MNRKLKTLLATGILLILSLNVCCAQEDKGWWDIAGRVIEFITSKIVEIGVFVFSWIGEGSAAVLNALIVVYKAMILWNPNPEDMSPLVDRLMKTLIPVYVLAITCIGVYFVFVAAAPAHRARAKDMLLKLILSMILVTVSLEIYQILLDISMALSRRLLAGVIIEGSALLGAISTIGITMSLSTGFTLPLTFLIILILAGVSIGIRHFLVQLMAALFPLTLFLYFFEFTKSSGYKLMRYSFVAIFTQTVQALILAVTITSVNALGENPDWMAAFMCVFIGMGGFVLLALSPLMLLGIMKWIGGAVAGVGTAVAFIPGKAALGGAMTAMGGVAAGMGPGGLIAGGTVYGLGKTYAMNMETNAIRNELTQKKPTPPDKSVLATTRKQRQWERHKKQSVSGKSHDRVLEEETSMRYGVTKEDKKEYGLSLKESVKANKNIEDFGAGISLMEGKTTEPRKESADEYRVRARDKRGKQRGTYDAGMRKAGEGLQQMESQQEGGEDQQDEQA